MSSSLNSKAYMFSRSRVPQIGQIDLSTRGTDLLLQKTRLGCIIGGSTVYTKFAHRKQKATCRLTDLRDDLIRFWEIEEGSEQTHFSTEGLACEEHSRLHIKRDETGRYIVALPFKTDPDVQGDLRARASKRLNLLRRKLLYHPELQRAQDAIIGEYFDLGFMTEVVDINETHGFYLPYHAVMKESSTTTKVRVLFDGSAKSSSGSSSNDILMVGPTIEDDLFSLVLRFRLHNYVITADIEKMYRQFLVRKEDRKYQ